VRNSIQNTSIAAAISPWVIGSAQRRGSELTNRVYPSISAPMIRPDPRMTHGTLTAPRL
jgi:hypothetical protein